MLRICVTVMPFAGHVGPMRPVVSRLVERGHDVRVYTGRRYADRFAAAGARVLVWQEAPDFDENDLAATFPALQGRKGPRQMVANLRHVFVGTAAGQVRDLLRAHAEEPWDVVLTETTSIGGGMAADATGTPWAAVSLVPLAVPSRDLPPPGLGLTPGVNLPGRVRDAALRGVARAALGAALRGPYRAARRSAGLGRPHPPVTSMGISPWLVTATSVPALEYPRGDLPPQVHLVGRVVAPPPAAPDPPSWWPEVAASDRPVVHVTQGTFNVRPGDLLLPALEGLAGEPVLTVATTGRRGQPRLDAEVPGNARVTDLLDHNELLPATSVMVTNGGWGGVTTALAHGVPLVVAGGDVDKPEVAARVAWSGAGIDLRTGTPTPRQVRDAVHRVLTDPRYREGASRVAAQLAEHDAATEIADLTELLARQRRPLARPVADPWRPAGHPSADRG